MDDNRIEILESEIEIEETNRTFIESSIRYDAVTILNESLVLAGIALLIGALIALIIVIIKNITKIGGNIISEYKKITKVTCKDIKSKMLKDINHNNVESKEMLDNVMRTLTIKLDSNKTIYILNIGYINRFPNIYLTIFNYGDELVENNLAVINALITNAITKDGYIIYSNYEKYSNMMKNYNSFIDNNNQLLDDLSSNIELSSSKAITTRTNEINISIYNNLSEIESNTSGYYTESSKMLKEINEKAVICKSKLEQVESKLKIYDEKHKDNSVPQNNTMIKRRNEISSSIVILKKGLNITANIAAFLLQFCNLCNINITNCKYAASDFLTKSNNAVINYYNKEV